MAMRPEEYRSKVLKASPQEADQQPTPARPKKEFSKLIFIGVSIVNLVIVAFTLVIVWRTSDTGPLAYLIPAAAAEMTAATGFYYNKAKAENKIKLMAASKKKGLTREDIDRFDYEDQ